MLVLMLAKKKKLITFKPNFKLRLNDAVSIISIFRNVLSQ
jgi:hypothetical protein